MMKQFFAAIALLSVVSAHAAWVTNDMRDIFGQPQNTPITFTPLSNPTSPSGTYLVNGKAEKVSPSSGVFSNWFEAGYYGVTNQSRGLIIQVPNDDGVYGLVSLTSTGLVSIVTNGNGFAYVAAGTNVTVQTNTTAARTLYTVSATASGSGSTTEIAPGANISVATNRVGTTNLFTITGSGDLNVESSTYVTTSPLTNSILGNAANATNWNGLTTNALLGYATDAELTAATNAVPGWISTAVGGTNTMASLRVTNSAVANNGSVTISNASITFDPTSKTAFNLSSDPVRVSSFPVATFRPTYTNQSLTVDIMPHGVPTNSTTGAWLDMVDRDLMAPGADTDNWRVVRMGIYTNGNATIGSAGWGSNQPGDLTVQGKNIYLNVGTTPTPAQRIATFTPDTLWLEGEIRFLNDNTRDLGVATARPKSLRVGTSGAQIDGPVSAVVYTGNGSGLTNLPAASITNAPWHILSQGANVTLTTNGNVVTVAATLEGGGASLQDATNAAIGVVTVYTNGLATTAYADTKQYGDSDLTNWAGLSPYTYSAPSATNVVAGGTVATASVSHNLTDTWALTFGSVTLTLDNQSDQFVFSSPLIGDGTLLTNGFGYYFADTNLVRTATNQLAIAATNLWQPKDDDLTAWAGLSPYTYAAPYATNATNASFVLTATLTNKVYWTNVTDSTLHVTNVVAGTAPSALTQHQLFTTNQPFTISGFADLQTGFRHVFSLLVSNSAGSNITVTGPVGTTFFGYTNACTVAAGKEAYLSFDIRPNRTNAVILTQY